ncbi:MAG: Gfo/Idh/MocA family oxidoreductase [Chloroflexota bacterium]|nr:MAG: gfo/Idh/MocA family oxidoreductase [Chloroflexota bacterium]
MSERLRGAIIGAGMMGQNHVRVSREIADIELVGVADADEKIRAGIEQRFGVPTFADYRLMLDQTKPDFAIIAVPTVFHREVTCEAMERDIHVLVEKPIAETEADGRAMIELAKARNVVLAVGHIERHNPAIRALKQRLDAGVLGQIFEMHAQRVGPFPARIRDVGVVLDLATHDIDVICHLAGSPVVRVFAETQQNIHSTREDTLSGMLRFANDITAVLQVNWLTPTKARRLTVLGAGGMYEVDYITQDLTFYENGQIYNGYRGLQLLRGVSEGRMIRDHIEKREPLRLEVEDFIAAIREGRPPLVTGEDSLKALRVAEALVAAGQEHRVIEFVQ